MGACASRQKVAGNPAGADGPARPPATRRGSVSAEADAAPPGAPSAAPPPSPAARARLEAALAAVPFLAGLDAAARADVAAAMRERRVAAGEVVIREGEEGDFFYLVASGRFAASVAGAPAREYAGAGHFGELALLHDCPRAATVACVAPGALWALGRADFRRAAVGAAGARRTAREALLRAAPAFAGLAPGRLAAVADCLAEVEFPPGAQVLAQGAPAGDDARFFVVEGGAVRCFRTGADVSVLEWRAAVFDSRLMSIPRLW
jgi:cAMP-dependent protein kinase regulator